MKMWNDKLKEFFELLIIFPPVVFTDYIRLHLESELKMGLGDSFFHSEKSLLSQIINGR